MVATFKDVYNTLEARGLHPKLHVLDNECSKAVQDYVRSEGTSIQPAGRINAAEPAVKSVKYHVLAGLATVHSDCLLQLWDRFLAQMQDTTNMLRTSRSNAKVSVYEEMEGAFDFNKTPMSILGTRD